MYLELIARVSTLIILFVLLCNCTLMKCQPKLTVQLHLVYKHVMSHIERLLHYATRLLGSRSFRKEKALVLMNLVELMLLYITICKQTHERNKTLHECEY